MSMVVGTYCVGGSKSSIPISAVTNPQHLGKYIYCTNECVVVGTYCLGGSNGGLYILFRW